jgi:hypothetical protein
MTIPIAIHRSYLLPLPFDLPFDGDFFAMASQLYNIMMKKTRGFYGMDSGRIPQIAT